MGLLSTVSIAKVGTKSLRTTVPEGIVAFLGIKEGDKLEWKMDVQNSIRVALVSKSAEFDEATRIASKHAHVKTK
jgi:bifunctional DNA-binding transcriptional regulator/antitoxin component of YhaV-PrlF toxin-antitoxin module